VIAKVLQKCDLPQRLLADHPQANSQKEILRWAETILAPVALEKNINYVMVKAIPIAPTFLLWRN